MKKLSHSRNSIYGFVAWIVPFGLTFLGTPFILRRIGAVEYGLYLLITGFIAYSFSFNFGRAITKFVADYLERGETEKAASVIVSTFLMSLTVGSIGCVLLSVFADFIVTDILQVDAAYHATAIRGFYIASICIWLTVLNFNFISLIQALHRFDIFSLMTVGSGATIIGGNVFLVWQGYSFNAMLLWNAAILAVGITIYALLIRRYLPHLKFTFRLDREIFNLTARYSFNVMSYQICGNLLLIFERGWITRTLGANDLTYYVVAMNFGIYIHALIVSFSTNFLAMTSVLFGRGEIERLRRIYQQTSKLFLIVVVFLCVTISVAGFEFLSVWINPEFAERANPVFPIHLATFGMLAVSIVAWQFVEGFGEPKYNFYGTLSWLIISVPLYVLLTAPYGIRGAATARFIGYLTIPIMVAAIERRIFGEIFWRFWLVNLGKSALTAAIAGTAEFYWLKFTADSWLNLFVGGIISGFVFLVFTLLTVYFSKSERDWMFGFFRGKLL